MYWRIGMVCLVAVVALTSAQAAEYYYFNKPAVSRDRYIADKVVCDRLSGGVSVRPREQTMIYVPQYSNLSAGQNALAIGLASLFAGLIVGNENRKVIRAVERTCMADKGYARYRVDKEIVKSIDKMPSQEQRIDRYFELAATAQPVGERIKE